MLQFANKDQHGDGNDCRHDYDMPKPYAAGLVDGRNQRCNTACDHLSRVRRAKAVSKKKELFSQDVKAPPKYYFAASSFKSEHLRDLQINK